MSDILKELQEIRDAIGTEGGIAGQLYLLNRLLFAFIKYLVEIEEEGRGDPEL